MPSITRENFVLITKRPGMKFVDISQDPDFKKELDWAKEGTLKEHHPDRGDVNHSPFNFHQNYQLIDPKTRETKDSVLVHRLCVPLLNDDGSKNEEGVIVLESEEDVVTLWKCLLSLGETGMKLDTRFGKDFSQKVKEELKLAAPAHANDDLMKPKKRR